MAAMRQSLKHPAEQDQDNDSDWEYEYHETETEVRKYEAPFRQYIDMSRPST